MGELLTFKLRDGAARRPPTTAPGGAEILFFMGVRYERHAEPLAAPQVNPREAKRGPGKTRNGGKRRA